MSVSTQFYICISILSLCLLSGARVVQKLDSAFHPIFSLLFVNWLTELTAYYSSKHYHNNMPVYHVYAPVLLLLVAWYYHRTVPFIRKWRLGIIISAAGFLFALLNALYLQSPFTAINSNFLLFEAFCIIIMALLSLFEMLRAPYMSLPRNPHFWINAITMGYWSLTVVIWGFFGFLEQLFTDRQIDMLSDVLWGASLLSNIGFGTVMYYAAKMKEDSYAC